MTQDATAQLIQKINAQLAQNGQSYHGTNISIFNQTDDLLSNFASYAQILSSASGPIAQAAAASALGAIAANQAAGAAAEASALATATSTGVGAALVLILSFILASIVATEKSGSAESQFLNQLGNDITDIKNATLAGYWQGKFTPIMSAWNTPSGGLGNDLDDLANQGTGGTYVSGDVSHWHEHALAFVNLFIPSRTPNAVIFWERPAVQDEFFFCSPSWYSDPDTAAPWQMYYPLPPNGPPLGGSDQQMVLDPKSMLPFLLIGINSYLKLQALVNFIDPSQPTFTQFLTEYQSDLQEYVNFISSQYKLSVNGIIKREVPNVAKLSDFVYVLNGIGPNKVSEGLTWNGNFGVVDSYPQYGAYQPSPSVVIPDLRVSIASVVVACGPSYIIDVTNETNANKFVDITNGDRTLMEDLADAWIVPWLQNRLTLAMMARWKAIYLFNGLDKVWSIIQKLSSLANQSIPLPPTLDQDGTLAIGNWSARELCKILNVGGDILDEVQDEVQGLTAGGVIGQYSVFKLVAALDNIANGSWGGPPSYSLGPPYVPTAGPGPTRPLGFRDRLAAAAIAEPCPPQTGP